MRVSAGEALGYVPEGVADHGIVAPQDARLPAALTDGTPFVLLFHATSNPDKQWPADHWAALATQMIARGVRVLLPWGSPAEHDDAQQIAARAPGAIVLPAMSVRELGAAIGLATLVVGVDTGFVHMAHALKRPTVMIFVATSRHHCGIGGAPHALSIGERCAAVGCAGARRDRCGRPGAWRAACALDGLTGLSTPLCARALHASNASTVTTAAIAARFASKASTSSPRQLCGRKRAASSSALPSASARISTRSALFRWTFIAAPP
jgi:hypothetical protein